MTLLRTSRPRMALMLTLLIQLGCGGENPQAPAPAAPVAPSISAPPSDVAVDVGATVTFSVSASGTGPLAYQWKRDGSAITGATSESYSLVATASDNQAAFSVEVHNTVGQVESRLAHLTVRTAPQITTQPQDQAVLAGVPVEFAVIATGTEPTYQWFRDGRPIPDATSSAYWVGVPMMGDNGAEYSVAVTNHLGSDTSDIARLSVRAGPGLRPTSYANSKGRNVGPLPMPGEAYTTRVWGSFFGAGDRDLFVATQVYGFDEGPENATRGEFQFWRWTGSQYTRVAGAVTGDAGCVHPRKAALADFNGDHRPDVFVACHGYDREPFPGEPTYVVLSQPDGTWKSSPVDSAGFHHNATAADLDGDGDTDVLVTDNFAEKSVFALVNDGQGGFTARPDLLPVGWESYFTVEAADVNQDGRVDILIGGHEFEDAVTAVLLNDGSGTFANVQPQVIPPVPNEGVVLDFVVLDADRNGINEIYVLRTSGGDGTFYESRTVQKVEWPSLTSRVLLSERGVEWVPFINPVFNGSTYSLVNDAENPRFELPLP